MDCEWKTSFGEKKIKGSRNQFIENKEDTASSKETGASALSEYVRFVKIHWKLVDLICQV